MSLVLSLQAGTVPSGTPLPGNAQAILTLVAQYMGIAGTQNFNGVNFGPNTPSADNRDKPWFKTDASGNPIGFFSWNGATWAAIPTNVANGPSSGRPGSPSVGTEYYDTTIGALLIYSPKGWTTTSGTVGDVKDVQAVDLPTALANNPGWAQDTQSVGLVVGAAGDATGITAAHPYGSIIGEENHVLQINELPAHTHPFTGFLNGASADGNTGPGGILSDHNVTATQSTGGSAGHNNIPPTIYYHRLVKQF